MSKESRKEETSQLLNVGLRKLISTRDLCGVANQITIHGAIVNYGREGARKIARKGKKGSPNDRRELTLKS